MSKRDLKLLERIFAAEVNGAVNTPYGGMPCSLKSKRLADLERDGFILRVEGTLPGRFPVKIKGWMLTDLGMLTYCQSCK